MAINLRSRLAGLWPAWRRVTAACLIVSVAACGVSQQRGDQLAGQLEAAFPDRITSVDYDTDDTVLFVEVVAMDPQVELRFLCDEINAWITARDGNVTASTSYGWWLSEDCPVSPAA
jgi:hypothetical protein